MGYPEVRFPRSVPNLPDQTALTGCAVRTLFRIIALILLLRAALWTVVKLRLAAMAHADSTAATYRIPVSGASGTPPPQNFNARPLVGAQSCRSMHTAACSKTNWVCLLSDFTQYTQPASRSSALTVEPKTESMVSRRSFSIRPREMRARKCPGMVIYPSAVKNERRPL